MNKKLDHGQKHVLQLIERDAGQDGWAKVSAMLYPAISKNLPPELVECELIGDAGRARLTEQGKAVFAAMEWL